MELRNKAIDETCIALLEDHILLKGEPRCILESLRSKYDEHTSIQLFIRDIDKLFTFLECDQCLDKLCFDLSLGA